MKSFVFSLLILGLFVMPAFAEAQLVPAGPPNLFGSSPFGTTSDEDFVDIYTRQLEYAEERQRFKTSMEARRTSFAIPRRQAVQNYQRNLAAFNRTRIVDFSSTTP